VVACAASWLGCRPLRHGRKPTSVSRPARKLPQCRSRYRHLAPDRKVRREAEGGARRGDVTRANPRRKPQDTPPVAGEPKADAKPSNDDAHGDKAMDPLLTAKSPVRHR